MNSGTGIYWRDEGVRFSATFRRLSLVIERQPRFERLNSVTSNVRMLKPLQYKAFVEGVIVRPSAPLIADLKTAQDECVKLANVIADRIQKEYERRLRDGH